MSGQGHMPRGTRVYANTTGGSVERLVWDDLGDAVLICSEGQFNALRTGSTSPMPIGFPKTELSLVQNDRRAEPLVR